MEEQIIKQYVADDGAIFETAEECEEYEADLSRKKRWEETRQRTLDEVSDFINEFDKFGEMTRAHMIKGVMLWEEHLAINCRDLPKPGESRVGFINPSEDEAADQESEFYEQEQT